MVAGTLGALIAPGSTGKSMLAMELAAYVAGANMLGQEWPTTEAGGVLILAIEDPENELFNRWADLGSHLSEIDREKCEQIRVVPMLGEGFDIMDDDYFNALLDACKGRRLLILDTYRRIHRLDENSGGDMSLVIGRLERIAKLTGCAIIFLHHTSKAAAVGGQGDVQQASRGSSVLVDNIRFQMYMSGMSDNEATTYGIKKENKNRFVRAGVSKVNYGPKLGDIWLHRTDGGILIPAEFPKKQEKTTKKIESSVQESWA